MIRVEDNFPAYLDRADRATSRFLSQVGMLGERKAFEYAPKGKTRGLSNSIGNRVEGDVVSVYANIEYAKYQEGDPYQKRFLGRALEDMVRRADQEWRI